MEQDNKDFLRRSGPRGLILECAAIALLASGLGVYLQWEEFNQPDRFHNNWRQSPHWLSPERQQFQPDDLLIRYAHFNTSHFANFLYKNLARTGYDVFWGKFNAVLFFAFTALAIFVTARAMGGRLAGWSAAAIFMLFPSKMEIFVGGFMSGLSMPFLCLTVLFVYRKRWWWMLPLVMLEAFIYPMAALQSGMILILDFLAHDRGRLRDPELWKRKLLPLSLAAAACCLVLLTKYLGDQHEFGRLVNRVEMNERRLDFSGAGRARLLPVYPVTTYMERYCWGLFRACLMLAAFVGLGRRMLRLPRGLWTLMLSGILMYWLADVMMMKMYFPTRYVHRAFPLFMALAGGYWISQLVAREVFQGPLLRLGRFRLRYATVAILALLAVGWYDYGSDLQPGHMPTRRFSKHELYERVRALPGRPLLAAHPRLASEILFMSGKSVLVSKELTHPWWTGYWKTITERTHDFFRAYYTKDPQVLKSITSKYDIDYWVVDRGNFKSRYLKRGNFHIQPFSNWVQATLRPGEESVIREVPERYRLYNGKRFFLVSTADLMSYLDGERAPLTGALGPAQKRSGS